MGLNGAELAILSLLLKHKSPNTRRSTVELSNDILPVQVESGESLENIQEVIKVMNSLEMKGIIKIDDLLEVSGADYTSPVAQQKLTETEKLNLVYILGNMTGEEYEKLFSESLAQQSSEGRKGVLPITIINRFLLMLKLLAVMRHINFKLYDTLLAYNSELRELKSLIEDDLAALNQKLLGILLKYMRYVEEIIDKNDSDTTLIGFLYLYPFLRPFTKKVKMKKMASDKELEKLRKEIQVEKEIVYILEMLKEDAMKIERHKEKLQTLEEKLKTLESSQEKRIFIVTLPGAARGTDTIKDELKKLLGRPAPDLQNVVNEFMNILNTILYKVFKDITPDKEGRIKIDLHRMLEKLQTQEHKIKEERYQLRVFLSWMNEHCPVMQDSIIDSAGRELILCKNPECFVVYHERCLDTLRKSGCYTCLVCGSRMT